MWTDRTAAKSELTNCSFCAIDPSAVDGSNELVFAVRDAHPVTPLHTLVLPRRHVSDYFDFYLIEVMGIDTLLRQLRQEIAALDAAVEGFTVGIHIGAVAGRRIDHCHVHLMPRRRSDRCDPWPRNAGSETWQSALSKLGFSPQ